ncbi:MAG: EutN/CcmL family microcompartment protein [Opitutales bacterium]
MILARIDGHCTTTVCHPSLRGQRLVLCTPVNERGETTGNPIAAFDPLFAGRGARVMISTDGGYSQACVGDDQSPIRNQVMGMVDETERV